jgi:hypothetical protein
MFKLQILSLLLPLRADVLTANISAEGRHQKIPFWVVFHPIQRIVCISVNSAWFHMKLSQIFRNNSNAISDRVTSTILCDFVNKKSAV